MTCIDDQQPIDRADDDRCPNRLNPTLTHFLSLLAHPYHLSRLLLLSPPAGSSAVNVAEWRQAGRAINDPSPFRLSCKCSRKVERAVNDSFPIQTAVSFTSLWNLIDNGKGLGLRAEAIQSSFKTVVFLDCVCVNEYRRRFYF